MDRLGIIAGFVVALGLACIAACLAVRQLQLLKNINIPSLQAQFDDPGFLSRQAKCRLLGCLLLGLIAVMLAVGLFMQFDFSTGVEGRGIDGPMPEETRQHVLFLAGYWGTVLLLLFALLVVAVIDMMATARFGLRQVRRLEETRREALEADLTELRRRRAEMN
jgi:hypothetical protein